MDMVRISGGIIVPRSVVRALQILDILSPSEDGLSHAQITKTLGIPKSSVSPILHDLTSHDFISYDQSTRRYTLGPKVTSLAHNYLEKLDLIKIGGPVVKGLARMTGESVALYIRSNTE
jgi:IclR family KDG regulon transcriptional repressor